MRAVLRLVAYEFRGRWRGWTVLVLLLGLAGGAVLAAAAGARRTGSAYPRFLVASRASDVLIGPGGPRFSGSYDDALAGLPGVAAIAPVVGLNAQPVGPGGKLDNNATVVAPLDGRFGRTLEIPKLLAGRQPAPDRPGEVMVDQVAARDLHLRVGSRLELGAVAGAGVRHLRRLSARVVGIMATRGSIVPVNLSDQTPVIVASRALFRELGPRYGAFDGAYVKLRPGETVSDFSRRAQALTRGFPATGGQIFVSDEAAQAAAVERSIRPQAVALALFALILAITALLIVGQTASRLLLAASSDNRALAALGMTRRQLLAAALAETGLAAAAGAARGPGDAAKGALVPQVARESGVALERLAGLNGTVSRLAGSIGPAIAGVLVAVSGPLQAVALDAGSFGIAAAVVAWTIRNEVTAEAAAEQEPYLRRLGGAFTFLRGDRLLLQLTLMVTVTNLLDNGVMTVLLPVWARHHGGPAVIGVLTTAVSITAMAGSIVASAVAGRMPRRATYFLCFVIGGGPRIAMLALGVPLWATIAVWAVSGLALGFVNPILSAVLYERIPARVMGRVSALTGTLGVAGTPLGGPIAGLLVGPAGLATAALVFGGVYLAATSLPARGASWGAPPAAGTAAAAAEGGTTAESRAGVTA